MGIRVTRTENKKKKTFLSKISLTNQLIILNLVFYFVSLLLLSLYGEDFFTNNIALTPNLILSGRNLWTLLTSMFSHLMFFHIFANMFSLFFIGNFLEKIIGKKRFFWVYMISGIVGGLFFVLASLITGANNSAIGASGAIFGLLGVLAVLVPKSRIYLIAGPIILIIVEVFLSSVLPANVTPVFDVIVNILFFVMLFSIFSINKKVRRIAIPIELPMWLLPIVAIVPLVIVSYFVPLPIGNSAHFGGLVVGLIYGFILRRQFPNKVRKLGRIFR